MKLVRALCAAAAICVAVSPRATAQIPRDTTPVVAKTTPVDIAAGKLLYEATCSKCHGLDGAVDGKQYVFVTAGTTYFSFAPP